MYLGRRLSLIPFGMLTTSWRNHKTTTSASRRDDLPTHAMPVQTLLHIHAHKGAINAVHQKLRLCVAFICCIWVVIARPTPIACLRYKPLAVPLMVGVTGIYIRISDSTSHHRRNADMMHSKRILWLRFIVQQCKNYVPADPPPLPAIVSSTSAREQLVDICSCTWWSTPRISVYSRPLSFHPWMLEDGTYHHTSSIPHAITSARWEVNPATRNIWRSAVSAESTVVILNVSHAQRSMSMISVSFVIKSVGVTPYNLL